MMRALGVLLVAAAFAIGLYLQGWVAVPVVGACFGAAVRRRSAPADAMVGAMLASLALLLPQTVMPAFPRLLEQLGSIFPMPGIGVFALTVLIHMILAFTSARVAIGVVGVREAQVVRVDPAPVRGGG